MKNNGIVYTYPLEILLKFRNSSTEWKLNWLEEANKLTFKTLTRKGKALRGKIRKGLVK